MVGKRAAGVFALLAVTLALAVVPGCGTERTIEPVSTAVIPTLDGGQVDFGALQGRDVFLWFWAPW